MERLVGKGEGNVQLHFLLIRFHFLEGEFSNWWFPFPWPVIAGGRGDVGLELAGMCERGAGVSGLLTQTLMRVVLINYFK